MKCPHCLENFVENWETNYLRHDDVNGTWRIEHCVCANENCQKIIIKVIAPRDDFEENKEHVVIPKGVSRRPTPSEVPDGFSDDYKEACLVLADSPKASAALSRRCLQHLLREKAGIKHSDLYSEIQEVLDSNILPSDLSEQLDAVRVIGNFAAHPTKSKGSGEIVGVETGEAEWNLEVLEELFDFYFVRPSRTLAKKTAINAKLTAAGKPTLE